MNSGIPFRSGSLLGIAISDRDVVAAQVAGRRSRLQAYTRWEIPAGLSLSQPRELGRRMAVVLKEKGFTARKAVVGVPARWLIAESRELPPVGKEQALSLLRLQTERLGAGDDAGIVFDVAGDLSSNKATVALLVGIASGRLAQLKELCQAAELELAGVTATGLALSQTFRHDAGDVLVLFGGHGTELVRRNAGRATGLRHLNGVPQTGQGVLPALTSELTRALAIGGTSAHVDQSVVLIGDSSLEETQYDALSERLGRQVRSTTPLEALSEVSAVGSLNGEAHQVIAERIWPAIALAGLGGGANRLPVDFLEPKLAPPKESRIRRQTVLAMLACVTVLAALVWLVITVHQMEQEAVVLEEALEARQPEIAAAQATLDALRVGRTYFESRPSILDALAELARTFPEEGSVWASAFTMRPGGKGQLTGKASDQQAILSVRDALMADPAFEAINLIDSRAAGGRGGEVSFSLSFTYVPQAEGAPRDDE